MRNEPKLALLLVAFLLLPLLAPLLLSQDPLVQNRQSVLSAPSLLHWFGTDEYGRDLFSRFLHGGRLSTLFGVAATALCLLLGWALGGLAALLPRAAFVLWIADLFLLLPWVYLLLAARAALPLDLPASVGFALMLLLMALTGWARPARLVRARILAVKERGYIQAARQFGVSPLRIFVRHILPATYDLLLAQAILLFPRFVLAQVTLSFLGVASLEPAPSWGALILPIKQVYLLGDHWWRLLPLLAMAPYFAILALCARKMESRQSLWR